MTEQEKCELSVQVISIRGDCTEMFGCIFNMPIGILISYLATAFYYMTRAKYIIIFKKSKHNALYNEKNESLKKHKIVKCT
jgi:hypothetical protein